MYAPGAVGVTTVALTVTVPFTSTFAGSGVRTPSHTTVWPLASCQ